jgi:hypothetical protein
MEGPNSTWAGPKFLEDGQPNSKEAGLLTENNHIV